jgi:hypothetical protein
MDRFAAAGNARDRDDSSEWASEIASLRGAVRQHVQAPETNDDRLLRAVVAPIARKFRNDGHEVARLVVRFKEAWVGLPEVDMLARHESQALLDRAVSLLIEEYYAA